MAVILKLVIFLNTVRPFNSISLLLNDLFICYQENIREFYFNSMIVKEDLELKEFWEVPAELNADSLKLNNKI